jgi:peroxiredoxin
MTPHLVKWQTQFADRGFTVLEIDNGQMDSFDALKSHVVEAGITFPVLHDQGGKVCGRFGVRAYPTAYLIGRDGTVLWEGHPGNVDAHEQAIEQALAN